MKLDELLEGLKDLSKDYDENAPEEFGHFTGRLDKWGVEMTKGARKILRKYNLLLDDTYSDAGTSARHEKDHDSQTLKVTAVSDDVDMQASLRAAIKDLQKSLPLHMSMHFSEGPRIAWITIQMKPTKVH